MALKTIISDGNYLTVITFSTYQIFMDFEFHLSYCVETFHEKTEKEKKKFKSKRAKNLNA